MFIKMQILKGNSDWTMYYIKIRMFVPSASDLFKVTASAEDGWNAY